MSMQAERYEPRGFRGAACYCTPSGVTPDCPPSSPLIECRHGTGMVPRCKPPWRTATTP